MPDDQAGMRDLLDTGGGCQVDMSTAEGVQRWLDGFGGARRFRVTVGLRGTKGRWRITHLHAWVPFRMDQTFRAAVDLQPWTRQGRPLGPLCTAAGDITGGWDGALSGLG